MMIGVTGTHRGAGSTHLAMMLAVFCGITMGERTAIVEMNRSGCFRQARIIRSAIDGHKNKYFHKKISIFEQSGIKELADIVSMGYSYIITDFGYDCEAEKEAFLLCNRKLIIGNLSWWKLQHYAAYAVKCAADGSMKDCTFLANCCNAKTLKYMKRHFNINITEIPYMPDPYTLGEKELLFMQKLTSSW